MEWKIGEVRQVNGEWYQCVKNDNTCAGCSLFDNPCNDKGVMFGECSYVERSDRTSVIFKKLEKVGEPFIGKVHFQFQRYKIYAEPIIAPAENIGYINEENTIAIEIKESKEDNNGMTLDDAIKHYDEVGKHSISKECTLKNFQVRDWLIELKKYKEKEHFNSESIGNNLQEFDEVEILQENTSDIDWEQVRIKTAILSLQGFASNTNSTSATVNELANWSVSCADNLIAELKKGGEK